MTLSRGLEIQLSDFEAENATLKGDYVWQVGEIVIGGVPTIPEVYFVCLIKFLSRILLQGTISTNLLDLKRHQAHLRTVNVGIDFI